MRALADSPRARAVVVYGVLFAATLAIAYWAIFSVFAPYDDEGTLLVTLRAFVHGDRLYNDIYSPYGPFYYEVFGGLFAFTGKSVSTDSGRMIVIILWASISLLMGLAVHRMTGMLALGAAAMAVTVSILHALVGEPMHPISLDLLVQGSMVLIAAAWPARRRVAAGVGLGALVGALTLTKINLGLFAVAAIVLAATMTVESLRSRRWITVPVTVAFMAMPLVLMAGDLGKPEVRDLLLLYVTAALALVIAARSVRPQGDAMLRPVIGIAAGFGAAFLVIIGVILINGTSLSALYDNTVTEAMRQRDILEFVVKMPPDFAYWSIAGVAAAAFVVRLDAGRTAGSPWPGVLRIIAGAFIWFRIAPLGPPANTPTPLALAWIAAIPPGGRAESPERRFARLFLPALAVAELLQVYPVSGTQLAAFAVLFVPLGGLCIADGLASLRAWSEATGRSMHEFRAGAAAGAIAVAAMFVWSGIVRPGALDAHTYARAQGLPFYGVSRLRPPDPGRTAFIRMGQLVQEHQCTMLAGLPLNSLNIWTGVATPRPTIPNTWIRQLDAARQQRVVDGMEASPRPCIVSKPLKKLNSEQLAASPLARYVRTYVPVEQSGIYTFMVPPA